MGLDRELVFGALFDPNSEFTSPVGNGLPAEFCFVRSPDANLCTGQSKTLLCKHGGEYDEVVNMRVALPIIASAHARNRTRRKDKHQRRKG